MSYEKAVADLKKATDALEKEYSEYKAKTFKASGKLQFWNVDYGSLEERLLTYSPQQEDNKRMSYDEPVFRRKRPSTNEVLFADPNEAKMRTKIWRPAVKLPQLEELIEAFLPEEGICIAGGSVLGSYLAVGYGDIDVFPFGGPKNLEKAYQIVEGLGYEPDHQANHCRNYKHPSGMYRDLQVISVNGNAKSAFDIIKDFDLSVCQVAIWQGKLITTKLASEDTKIRLLRCVGSASLGDTVRRIEKYRKRGFKVLGLEEGQSLLDYLQAAEEER